MNGFVGGGRRMQYLGEVENYKQALYLQQHHFKTKKIFKTNKLKQNTSIDRQNICQKASSEFENYPQSQGSNSPLSVAKKAYNQLSRCVEIVPQVAVLCTAVALAKPSTFVWFKPNLYAPSLGMLMLSIGLSVKKDDFKTIQTIPLAVAHGTACQWILKPVLGLLIAIPALHVLKLSQDIINGFLLMCCVSGAQLSNYATFLIAPHLAPLSITLTSLSTLMGVVLIPLLSYLSLGSYLPVDPIAMSKQIVQIVIAPIALGLTLQSTVPALVRAIRPAMSLLSLTITGLCIGSSLAINVDYVTTPQGLQSIVPVVIWHVLCLVIGYYTTRWGFRGGRGGGDLKGLCRCIGLESGMQSTLLSLLLASKFFEGVEVCVPSAVSVVVMTLLGFVMVGVWKRADEKGG